MCVCSMLQAFCPDTPCHLETNATFSVHVYERFFSSYALKIAHLLFHLFFLTLFHNVDHNNAVTGIAVRSKARVLFHA